MQAVEKHGSHDQKSHGRGGGGAREVAAKDVDSAWDAVLSDEARTIDDPKKAHPEKYDSRGKLKDGEVETRRVRGEGPPRVRDYETNESVGLSWSEAAKVEGALGLGETGDFTMRVPTGPARPPQHVYRVMSTAEFDQARERGFIKSDERMNLVAGEGTVTSLRSTGDFYAPVDGSSYRVVRIKYEDADGWRTDTDGYIKTQERVPFDRVDLYSSPITNPRVFKHGSHNQASHNPHKGGASDLPEGWSQKSKDDILAQSRSLGQEFYPNDPARAESFATSRAESITEYNGPNGSVVRVTLTDGSQPDPATMNTALTTINRLQEQKPVKDLRVEFSDAPWRDHAADVSEDAKGFVMRGEKTINIRPQYATGQKMMDVDDGFFMPSAQGTDQLDYVLTHEYGHVLDRRSRGEVNDDRYNNAVNNGSLSKYGQANEYEAYAESFAEYSLTGGKTTNPAVLFYADRYFWGENMTKAVDDDVFDRVIIFDTFDAVVPPIVKEEIAKAVYVAFAPGLRPVLKHGSHDQKSHGRRGGGLSSGRAADIIADVRADGGLTVNMVDGSKPTGGYMVAVGGTTGSIVSEADFFDPQKGPEALGSYFKEHKAALSGGTYLGVWHNKDDGQVYLDLSENIMDQAEAISLGSERDQISIWDVANFEEINTGGTGQVGKAVAGGEDAGSVEDDGRGDRRLRKDRVGEGDRAAVVYFEPGLRPVLKHGSHDQSSHGRRGGGGGEDWFIEGAKAEYRAREAAITRGDFSGYNLGESRLIARIGGGIGRMERRIREIAENMGIVKRPPRSYTAEEAMALRRQYEELG